MLWHSEHMTQKSARMEVNLFAKTSYVCRNRRLSLVLKKSVLRMLLLYKFLNVISFSRLKEFVAFLHRKNGLLLKLNVIIFAIKYFKEVILHMCL